MQYDSRVGFAVGQPVELFGHALREMVARWKRIVRFESFGNQRSRNATNFTP